MMMRNLPCMQFKKITPCGGRTLVKAPSEDKQQSMGGVLLPTASSASNTTPTTGIVVDVDKPASDDKTAGTSEQAPGVSWEIGSKVCYSSYAGTTLAVGDDNFVLLKHDDVLGVLPSEDNTNADGQESIKQLKPNGPRLLVLVSA